VISQTVTRAVDDRAIPAPLHVSESGDSVRVQLARELHDTVVQTLQLMLVEMEQFKLRQFDPEQVLTELNGYQTHTRGVLVELRSLLYELRDDAVIDTNFTDEMRVLVRSFEQRSGIRSKISISRGWPSKVRNAAGQHVRRIVEESLNNVRRHSEAATCQVALREEDRQTLQVLVKDDGIGLARRAEEIRMGMGLSGIRERVLLLGGRLSLTTPSEGGTVLQASIPRESLL
jgi:signal transduction histidine kinase